MYRKFAILLERTNKTAYRVAKDTGISKTTFSDWKSGRSQPKVDKLKKLAEYFGVTVDYFVAETEAENNARKGGERNERNAGTHCRT